MDLSGKNGLVQNFFPDKDEQTSTPHRRFLAGDGQMADGVYNPFTRYGYMSPANTGLGAVTAATSSYNQRIECVQLDEDNDDFYLAGGTQIWKGDTGDDETLALQNTITDEDVTDLEIYQVNGVKKIFISYNKSSSASDIGIATLPYASNTDQWLSTTVGGDQFNLSAGAIHKMIVSDNGFMYVLDGNSLHKIDGTTNGGANGTASANVLVFPPYLNLYDAVDFRGKLYIVVQDVSTPNSAIKSGKTRSIQAGIYVWDRQSTTVAFTDFFPVEGVQAIHKIYVSPEGDVRIMVTTSDGLFQIRSFTGNTFKTIQEAGDSAAPRFRDAVSVGNKYVTWFGTDGYMYAHGKTSHLDKEGIFKYGTIVSDANNTSGAIIFAGGNSLGSSSIRYEGFYISYNISSTVYVKKWIPNALSSATGIGFTQDSDIGNVYSPLFPLPVMSTVKNLRIYCLPPDSTGSTATATIKFYFNQSTTASFSKTLTRTDIAKGYIDIAINKPFVTSIQLETEFNINQLVGGFDYSPYLGVLEYEPTSTAKSNPA